MRTKKLNSEEMVTAIDQVATDWHKWYAPGRVEAEDIANVLKTLIDCDTNVVRENDDVFIDISPQDKDVQDLLDKIDRHHGVPMYLAEKDIETIKMIAGRE